MLKLTLTQKVPDCRVAGPAPVSAYPDADIKGGSSYSGPRWPPHNGIPTAGAWTRLRNRAADARAR